MIYYMPVIFYCKCLSRIWQAACPLSPGAKAVIPDRDSLHQFSIVIFYETRPGIAASEGFAVINLLGLRFWLSLQQQT